MAGTVRRGDTPEEDEALVAGLRRSVKEAEEHRLLVEAVVSALAPVCAGPPTAGEPDVVRFPTVSHLATRVSGVLRDPAPSALALAGRLHPTPAVGGLPRAEALAAIAALEGFDRGLYAGPVGWVDANGDGEWAVALRGAQLDGPRARLVAGAGIVAGSDPDAEWAETEAKLRPMLAAVGALLRLGSSADLATASATAAQAWRCRSTLAVRSPVGTTTTRTPPAVRARSTAGPTSPARSTRSAGTP